MLFSLSLNTSGVFFFVFNDTATTVFYTYCHTLSLHYALPICPCLISASLTAFLFFLSLCLVFAGLLFTSQYLLESAKLANTIRCGLTKQVDRKSTRLNSSHLCAPRMPSSA